jgi:hypothetical protein
MMPLITKASLLGHDAFKHYHDHHPLMTMAVVLWYDAWLISVFVTVTVMTAIIIIAVITMWSSGFVGSDGEARKVVEGWR